MTLSLIREDDPTCLISGIDYQLFARIGVRQSSSPIVVLFEKQGSQQDYHRPQMPEPSQFPPLKAHSTAAGSIFHRCRHASEEYHGDCPYTPSLSKIKEADY